MDVYDVSYRPPAPVLNVKVFNPYSMHSESIRGLVDSGGDGTSIPNTLISKLQLIPAGSVEVSGYKDPKEKTEELTYYVNLSLKNFDFEYVEVITTNDKEACIGRDILNRLKILLDGKNLNFEITDPK